MGWFGPDGDCGCCVGCGGDCAEEFYESFSVIFTPTDPYSCDVDGLSNTFVTGEPLKETIPKSTGCVGTFSVGGFILFVNAAGPFLAGVSVRLEGKTDPSENKNRFYIQVEMTMQVNSCEIIAVYEKEIEFASCSELESPITLDEVSIVKTGLCNNDCLENFVVTFNFNA